MKSDTFGKTSDWLEDFPLNSTGISFYSDELTDYVNSGEKRKSLNFSYYFPMYGDANVRMLVIVQLDPDAVARSFLSSSAADYGFAILKNADGTVLAQHNLPDQFSSNGWKLLDLRQSSQGYLTIGIKNTYF